jgi:hypothetical protein
MPDFYELDDKSIILDLVDNPVNTQPDPVSLTSCEFNAARPSWIVRQAINPLQDSFNVIVRNFAKVFGYRALKP